MGIRGRETITIERRAWGADDEYGNPTMTTTNVVVPGCLIGWGVTGETGDLFGVSIDTQATIQLPQGTPVHKNDIFILPNGKRYVLNGDAIQWIGQMGNPIKQKKLVNVIIKENSSNA